MKKKIFALFLCFLLQISASYAATQLKVIALEEFQTENPTDTIDVKVLNSDTLGKYNLETGTVLHCNILAVVDPKRGKRNASFYVQPTQYTYNGETYTIKEDLYGKYSKFVLSKEEIKNIPPGKVIKSAALSVGNYFVKGLSIAYSFVEGVAKNERDNRLKSGVVNAYEHSPLSLVSEGEQLDIKVGDDFYLVFKTKEDETDEEYKEASSADNEQAISETGEKDNHIRKSKRHKKDTTDDAEEKI